MLPMDKSVTFTGACANEIILRNNSGFFLTKGKSEVRISYRPNGTCMVPDLCSRTVTVL